MSVIIDCDNWKLKFYVDNEMVFDPIDIISNKTYHPIFTEWSCYKKSYQMDMFSLL